jgi:transcriptional regulator with XRE-family HTH domain
MEHPDFAVAGPFSGTRLRTLREQRGISRQQLAQKAQLSRAYIYLLEGDSEDEAATTRRPSYDVVVRLAGVLDVLPEAFASGSERSLKANEAAAAAIAPALREAVERFDIPPEDVQELARFAFRGRRPVSPNAWGQLWMAIRNSVGMTLP